LKVDLTAFEPRLRQISRSFISLFAHNDEEVQRFKEYLKKYQDQLVQERSESFDGILVNCIAKMIIKGDDFISAKDIIDFTDQLGIDFQYKLTSKAVTKCLRGLGLQFNPLKRGGRTKRALVLDESILKNIFSRYIIDDDMVGQLALRGFDIYKELYKEPEPTFPVEERNEEIEKLPKKLQITEVTNIRGQLNLVTKHQNIHPPSPLPRNLRNRVTVYLPCSICNTPESITYTSSGKPVCANCAESCRVNGVELQDDLIVEEEKVGEED